MKEKTKTTVVRIFSIFISWGQDYVSLWQLNATICLQEQKFKRFIFDSQEFPVQCIIFYLILQKAKAKDFHLYVCLSRKNKSLNCAGDAAY